MKNISFILIICIVFIGLANAATITVGLTGGYDYTNIQAAIDSAANGDTIIVADGNYTGTGNYNIDFNGKAITLESENGPEHCAIDMQSQNVRAFYFHSGETSTSIVSGLKIKSGYRSVSSTEKGGIIQCSNSSPKFINCIITGNKVYGQQSRVSIEGGAIYCESSQTVFENCIISNNQCSSEKRTTLTKGCNAAGGAVACVSSSNITLRDCIITNNSCIGGEGGDQNVDGIGPAAGGNADGGGVYCNSSSTAQIINCLLEANKAQAGRGGEYSIPPNVYGQTGDTSGGGIVAPGVAVIQNCTVVANTLVNSYSESPMGQAVGYGICGSSNANIINSIIWNDIDSDIGGTPIVTYTCTKQYLISGTGNMSADPLFVSGPLGNYYLGQTASGQAVNSPCINSGSDAAINLGMNQTTTRTDHVPDAGIVDMGFHYGTTFPAPTVQDVNFDDDNDVDFIDFAILASQWRQTPGTPPADVMPPGGDGLVDFKDLDILAKYWLFDVVVPPPPLISHWKFDEQSGTTAADSAGSNTGTLSGNTIWQPAGGQINGALEFDGSNDYVQVASNSTLDSTTGTWCFWIKPTGNPAGSGSSPAGSGSIISRANSSGSKSGIYIALIPHNTYGTINPAVSNSSSSVLTQNTVIFTPNVNYNSWSHVAFVFTAGNNTKLYINGSAAISYTLGTFSFNNQVLRIATDTNTYFYDFKGLIDDVRIYNTALSDTDVQQLYQDGLGN